MNKSNSMNSCPSPDNRINGKTEIYPSYSLIEGLILRASRMKNPLTHIDDNAGSIEE